MIPLIILAIIEAAKSLEQISGNNESNKDIVVIDKDNQAQKATNSEKKSIVDDISDHIKNKTKTRGDEFMGGNNEVNYDGIKNLQNVETLINKAEELSLFVDGGDKIGTTAKIVFYNGLDLSIKDNYKIFADKEIEKNRVLVFNENKKLCALLSLAKTKEISEKNEFFLVGKKENILFENVRNSECKILIISEEVFANLKKTPAEINENEIKNIFGSGKIIYKELQIEVRELDTTEAVLCIDFGTTNTTVGAFLDEHYVKNISNNDKLNGNILLNEINFVNFFMQTYNQNLSQITPTIAYVKECSNPEDVRFLFGYEAQSMIKSENYCPKATTFYEIKRWINNIEDKEFVKDEVGNKAEISRKEIIKKYLDYIIEAAQHQFKCKFKNIHLTSPVKLKAQYLLMFEEILKGYVIEKSNALDEGIAVLYDVISDRIEKAGKNIENGKEYKALVIDCGGGTSDLASCTYTVTEGQYSYILKMKTTFENGDSNFGGNNITYRIMQYMKILYANFYSGKPDKIDIDTLINLQSSDIFRCVDDNGVETLYKDFQEQYEIAEGILPTKYSNYEAYRTEDYDKVKNNFYFIWEIAEGMKKQFFEKTNMIRSTFSNNNEVNTDNNQDMKIVNIPNWTLSHLDSSGKFVEAKIKTLPNVVFNIKEINKLIKGDIYNIVRKFLDKMYEEKSLSDYNITKLTGQSSKIDIFREALKEFIPGRAIKFKLASEENTVELKLSCLRGVIKYINAKNNGKISPEIINEIPAIPYDLVTYNFKNEEQILIKAQTKADNAVGSVGRPIGFSEIKFTLKDVKGKEQMTYKYCNNESLYTDVKNSNLLEQYKISQEEVDRIEDDSVKVFIMAAVDSWGFFVVPVKKSKQKISIGKKQYFGFEADISKVSFFDGYK